MYNYDNELMTKRAGCLSWVTWYTRLRNLACTMFEWKNLPISISERFLEECLYQYGYACIFKNPTNDLLMGLQCNMEGLNFYDDPVNVRPISPVQTFDAIPFDECVLVRNTPDMYPTIMTTLKYTEELYDIDESRDVNIRAQKTPILILTDMKQKQTMQAMYQKYNGNSPVIYGYKDNFDQNNFTVLKTDAPFVAGQLQDIKTTIYNEYLSSLGIGITEFKKERSITAESEQYTAQANALAQIGLTERQEACDKINRIFGDMLEEPVSVHIRANYNIGSDRFSTSNSTVNYCTIAVDANNKGDDN